MQILPIIILGLIAVGLIYLRYLERKDLFEMLSSRDINERRERSLLLDRIMSKDISEFKSETAPVEPETPEPEPEIVDLSLAREELEGLTEEGQFNG